MLKFRFKKYLRLFLKKERKRTLIIFSNWKKKWKFTKKTYLAMLKFRSRLILKKRKKGNISNISKSEKQRNTLLMLLY
jgi:hypothetical protein